jgi:dTDP-4-amino-4,6-dideoxygalactose transaminase
MNGSAIAHFGLARQYRNLKEELLNATDQVLREGCLMSGPFTNKFETWLALKTGTEFAVTVHSGTQALEIIALWLRSQWFYATQSDIRPSVYIPNITYPATLNAFLNADYDIEILDTDKNGLMIEHNIEETACLVGLYGAKTSPANSNHIVDGAQHWLIADSGSVGMGMAISFDPTKNLPSSGNGGAIVTNDRELYEFAYNYRSNGKPDWHQMSGTNSKMSELDCAHLLVRANHLDNWQWRRKQIRYYYLEQFKNLPLRCLSRDFSIHADQKFVVYTENRDDLHEYLQKHNIESKVHYPHALSELPIARSLKKPDIVSTSVMLTKGVLSLPIYPELTDGEVEYISSIVCQFYDK